MKYLYATLFTIIATNASAIDCNTIPDCISLGYSKNDVDGCGENEYIYCPFDTSYKKCIKAQPDCASLGFTTDDKSSWCSSIITCPTDISYTSCISAIDKDVNCTDLGFTTSDKSSWCLSIITCPTDTSYTACVSAEKDCSGYTLSTCPTGGNCSECENRSGTHYKLIGAEDGYCYDNTTVTSVSSCNTDTFKYPATFENGYGAGGKCVNRRNDGACEVLYTSFGCNSGYTADAVSGKCVSSSDGGDSPSQTSYTWKFNIHFEQGSYNCEDILNGKTYVTLAAKIVNSETNEIVSKTELKTYYGDQEFYKADIQSNPSTSTLNFDNKIASGLYKVYVYNVAYIYKKAMSGSEDYMDPYESRANYTSDPKVNSTSVNQYNLTVDNDNWAYLGEYTIYSDNSIDIYVSLCGNSGV